MTVQSLLTHEEDRAALTEFMTVIPSYVDTPSAIWGAAKALLILRAMQGGSDGGG